jgi:hypothetical protein
MLVWPRRESGHSRSKHSKAQDFIYELDDDHSLDDETGVRQVIQ